ncbi:MAG: TPR repeat protein [Nitrospinales bacterium]|jgi:TPR repeat protein
MKTPLAFLLSLTFLFLFSGSVYGDDFDDGMDAYKRKDYKTAHRLYRLSAEQGHAKAQSNLGLMYAQGTGVLQDYALAHMWWNISGSNGNKNALTNRDIVEKKMTRQQIEKAQEMARNWKPNK